MFKAPEAIDPHGILPLQIALSDRLFPGVSTQHTRARYILFSGWHLDRLAATRSKRSTAERLRGDELTLMHSLLASDDTNGVFGKRAREKTKTLPTSVYWGLLQQWQIIPGDLSVADIGPAATLARESRAHRQLSDDAVHAEPGSPLTRVTPDGFPAPPESFPSAPQTFRLTEDEAEYLRDRATAANPDSFLRTVLERPELAEGDYPWSIDPQCGGQDLIDAREFSELIHPARLVYTKLLVDDARQHGHDFGDLEAQVRFDFHQWLEQCEGRTPEFRRWITDRLGALLSEPDIRLSATRQRFIVRSLEIISSAPTSCLDNPELHQRVRDVERSVKRSTARLGGGEPFRRWMKYPSRLASQRLDYRWGNVRRFVADLEAAT